MDHVAPSPGRAEIDAEVDLASYRIGSIFGQEFRQLLTIRNTSFRINAHHPTARRLLDDPELVSADRHGFTDKPILIEGAVETMKNPIRPKAPGRRQFTQVFTQKVDGSLRDQVQLRTVLRKQRLTIPDPSRIQGVHDSNLTPQVVREPPRGFIVNLRHEILVLEDLDARIPLWLARWVKPHEEVPAPGRDQPQMTRLTDLERHQGWSDERQHFGTVVTLGHHEPIFRYDHEVAVTIDSPLTHDVVVQHESTAGLDGVNRKIRDPHDHDLVLLTNQNTESDCASQVMLISLFSPPKFLKKICFVSFGSVSKNFSPHSKIITAFLSFKKSSNPKLNNSLAVLIRYKSK